MWLGFLFATAAVMGIDLCAMASIAAFPAPLRAALPIPADVDIQFGIAIGREDVAHPANGCRTTRAPLDANLTFVGF